MGYRADHADGVGGAEIAAVAGIDPYRSRLDIYEDKIGESEEVEPSNWHIDRGNFLEAGALQWLNKRTDIQFQKGGALRNKEYPFCIATPDGLARLKKYETAEYNNVAVAEIKMPSPFAGMDWGEDGTGADGVPKHHIPQVQWEMGAAGVKEAYVAALVGGFLRVYRMEFNNELFLALIDSAERFMKCVENRMPPAIDGGGPGEEWLKRKFPEHNRARSLVVAGPEQEELVDNYKYAYGLAKEWEYKKKHLANTIKQGLGNDPGLEGSFGKILWKQNKDGRKTDWQAYAKFLAEESRLTAGDWGEGIESFTRNTPGARPFRPYWKKEG